MKKLLIMFSVLAMTTAIANAGEVKTTTAPNADKKATIQKEFNDMRLKREAAFERRLGLTEVQKLKAREIRNEGHAKLKPIMEEIKGKHQEAEMVRRSRITVQAQEEKLAAIDEDLKVLEKKAQEIRKENMKKFESILTRAQKKTLKQMKKEGRDKFHRSHPMGKRPMPEQK